MNFTLLLIAIACFFAFSSASATEKRSEFLTESQDVGSGTLCSVCQLVVGYVDSFVKANPNATLAELEHELDQVCNLLGGSIGAQCTSFVNGYLPQVIQYIVNKTPSQVCQVIGVCTSSSDEAPAEEPEAQFVLPGNDHDEQNSVGGGTGCTICTIVVGYVEQYVKSHDNSTVEKVEHALDKVCDLLGRKLGADCTAFVDQYLPQVLQMVLNKEPAEKVCEQIKLCSSSAALEVEPEVVEAPAASGTLCSICELATGYVESFLKANPNATLAELEHELDQVCQLLGGSIGSQCTAFVNGYLPQVIEYVENKTPAQLCAFLGLCSSSADAAPPALPELVVAAPAAADSSACQMCETVSGFVITYIKGNQNATEAEIEKALDQVCNVLGGSIGAQCAAFVNGYLPMVIEAIDSKTPAELCAYIGLCGSSSTGFAELEVAAPAAHEQVDEDALCSICELVATAAESYLKANEKELTSMAEAELNKVCDALPNQLDEACKSFVAVYFPDLVKFATSKTPAELCAFVKACAAAVQDDLVLDEVVPAEPEQVEGSGTVCSICELVVGYVDSFVKANPNATIAELEHELDQVCNLLGGSIGSQCTAFVNGYLPQVLQYLISKTPAQVCGTIGVCASSEAEAADEVAAAVPQPLQVEETLGGSEAKCQICETIVDAAEQFAKSDSSLDAIEKALNSVCKLLGKSADVCSALVDGELQQILTKLSDKESAQTVCTQLRFCASA